MSTFEYNSTKAAVAQEKYCQSLGAPYFAPENGVCYRCGRNIYQQHAGGHGISVDEAGSRHITGCPHCFASYTD